MMTPNSDTLARKSVSPMADDKSQDTSNVCSKLAIALPLVFETNARALEAAIDELHSGKIRWLVHHCKLGLEIWPDH